MTKMEKAFAIAVNVFERAQRWDAFNGTWNEFLQEEYNQRPEVKAYRKAYMKAYDQRRRKNVPAPL